MKIAFFNIFQDGTQRGAETYAAELSERLSKNQNVNVFTEKIDTLQRWPILWRLYLDPHALKIAAFTLKNMAKLRKEKYDIIIALNGGWQPAILRIFSWIFGGKLIIPGQSGKGWDDRFNLWCFPDMFVGLTRDAVKWAKKVNPFVKSVVIPNGVNLSKFAENVNAYDTKLKKPIVLCVGAFTKEKRLELVIEAVSRLKNVNLLITGGGGGRRKELEEIGKNLLGERLHITSVPFSDMPSIYKTANIFTLPSWPLEAFGNVLVEAMASGLPVVATDDPIRREIVGDAGLFVDPEDTDGYAKALEKALNTNWGDKPRRQAEKYSWDKIALEYEKLFEDLVRKK